MAIVLGILLLIILIVVIRMINNRIPKTIAII